MTGRIYLSPPDVTELEEAAIVRAVRSGWIAPLGPEVDAFEAELAAYNEREHCVALSSGTAALHLGLLTLGVGPGDLVVTSSMTFAATVNAIIYTGADPVLVDSDESGNISAEWLAKALDDLAGEPVRAVVPVDLLGTVADQEAIAELAYAKGIPVLSDAAESLGAVRHGHPAGAFGDMAAVSFNGNKVMTTSGGGALLTDDRAVAERARYLATQARQPVVHYEHTEVGYNYRLSNLLAALGRAQLARLDSMLERRREIRRLYSDLFADVPGITLFGSAEPPASASQPVTRDNCWLTSILIDRDEAGFTSADLIDTLAVQNIEARPLWKPMHLQPAYSHARAYVDGTGERLFRTGLSLPSGSALTDADLARVTAAIGEFLTGRQDG